MRKSLKIKKGTSYTLNTNFIPLKIAMEYFGWSDNWFYTQNKKHQGLLKKIGGNTVLDLSVLNSMAKDLVPYAMQVSETFSGTS